jgi:hypothetical protein
VAAVSELPGREAFAAHVGAAFMVDGLGELRLEHVEVRLPAAGFEQFSLMFRGPRDPVGRQGTYRLVHSVLGALDIFLVPVGRDAAGTQYQAVFSHRVGEAGR